MGFWRKNGLKIGLIAVLLTAAGFFAVRGLRSDPLNRPDTLTFVCVTTGKVYRFPRDGKARPVPAENPDTHTMTLVPCMERDGGVFVSSRYRGTLQELKDANQAVDVSTLQVRKVE